MEDKDQMEESKIKKALEYSNRIIATRGKSFLVLDKNLRVTTGNQSFYDTFEVAEKETIGRLLFDLGSKQWNIPKLRVLFREILPRKNVVKDYEGEHELEKLEWRQINFNGYRGHHLT